MALSSRCDSREKTKGGGTRGSATTCSSTFQRSSRNANTRCVYNRLVVPPRFQRFELPERKAAEHFLASKWRDKKSERERESQRLSPRETNFASESNATTIPADWKFRVRCYSRSLYSIPEISRRLIVFDPIAVLSIFIIFCRDEDEDEEKRRRNFLEIGNSMTREKFSFPRVTKVISIRS